MKVVIVYESMFGNTEALAGALARGFAALGADVVVTEVGAGAQPVPAGCNLLVVAAPTHALSLSRRSSRAEAVERGAPARREHVGVREWLATVDHLASPSSGRPSAAVFDTRLRSVRYWPGSAATRAARALRSAGYDVVGRRSFYVVGMVGPLVDGEEARALGWAGTLASAVADRAGRVRA